MSQNCLSLGTEGDSAHVCKLRQMRGEADRTSRPAIAVENRSNVAATAYSGEARLNISPNALNQRPYLRCIENCSDACNIRTAARQGSTVPRDILVIRGDSPILREYR